MERSSGRLVAFGLVAFGLVGCGGKVVVDVSGDASVDTTSTAPDTAAPPATPDSSVVRPDVTTVDTRPPADDALPPATCPECVTANCRPQFEACMARPRCKAGVDCINACPGPSPTECRNKCISDAGGEVDAIVECVVAFCRAPCGF